MAQSQVLLYRSGLVTAASSFVAASSSAFLPEGNAAGDAIRQSIDLFYAAGAAGLGLSLVLIHIYVTPIKRFLQALWALGVLGSVGTYLAAAQPMDEGLVQYVLEHPAALWFVGPTFAALTGLVFKEGTASCCLSVVVVILSWQSAYTLLLTFQLSCRIQLIRLLNPDRVQQTED